MPQDDIAAQWKSFDPEKRDRLLKKMSPEQKKKLRGILEGKSATPVAITAQPPGAVKRFASSFASGAGVVSNEEGKNFFRHPIDTVKGMAEAQGELGARAGKELKSGDYVRGIAHGVEYLMPGLGPTLAHAGDQLESGDIAGGTGTTLGATTMIAASPENVKAGLSRVGRLRASAAERAQPFARKVTGVESAVKEEVGKTAEKHGEALEANKAKTAEVNEQNAEGKSQVAKHGELAKTVDEGSLKLHEHLTKVEKSVAEEANRKFDAVREKIGNPETSADPVVAAVRGVETDILQGIPENIKEFEAILKHEGIPDYISDAVREHVGFTPEGAEPLTWDKLQSIKSRLDARLRTRGTMNGDLKRAIYTVRDSVVDTMGQMAEANGASEEWSHAKSFWRQYKQDFHEPSGPSGSGSPIAQALDALDPKNIRQPFLNKQSAIGNRGVQILRKYPQHGGNEAAAHAENLIDSHNQMSDLPAKVKEKPLPKPPETPVVDVQKTARDAIAQRAKNWGSFNARDIGILSSGYLGGFIEHLFGRGGFEFPVAVTAYEGGKFAASRALNNPRVVEWLAKTPPEEAAVLAKIPGADKIRIVNGLTDQAIEQAKAGRPVSLSPAARQILGASNVARILAMSASNQPRVKNRQDALTLLHGASQ